MLVITKRLHPNILFSAKKQQKKTPKRSCAECLLLAYFQTTWVSIFERKHYQQGYQLFNSVYSEIWYWCSQWGNVLIRTDKELVTVWEVKGFIGFSHCLHCALCHYCKCIYCNFLSVLQNKGNTNKKPDVFKLNTRAITWQSFLTLSSSVCMWKAFWCCNGLTGGLLKGQMERMGTIFQPLPTTT